MRASGQKGARQEYAGKVSINPSFTPEKHLNASFVQHMCAKCNIFTGEQWERQDILPDFRLWGTEHLEFQKNFVETEW